MSRPLFAAGALALAACAALSQPALANIAAVQSHNVYNNAAANNVTGTLTSSPTVGDLLVAIVDLEVDLCVTNAGWTQISRQQGNGGMTLAYRVAQAGDTGSNLPIICHGLGSGGAWNASILELSGVNATPIDVKASGTENVGSSVSVITSGPITTLQAGDLLLTSRQYDCTVNTGNCAGLTPAYATSPASTGAVVAFNDSTHNGSGATQQVGYSFVNAATTLTSTFTYSQTSVGSQSSSPWSMVAFAPASFAGSGATGNGANASGAIGNGPGGTTIGNNGTPPP